MMDFEALAKQFSGRRLAELVLAHVEAQNPDQCRKALAEGLGELRFELRQPAVELPIFSSQCLSRFSGRISLVTAG
jgi:hypothetical protein